MPPADWFQQDKGLPRREGIYLAARTQSRPSSRSARPFYARNRLTGWTWSIVLLFLLVPGLARSQENPYKVKAAFLRNFAHYVNWPDNAFENSAAPWHIGILGQDPFGDMLEATLEGRTEQGRSFMVFRANRLEDLPPCHIVFVAYSNTDKRRAALYALKDKPVLTVGDAPEFLREGGVIGFKVDDRVSISINLDQARAVSLTIQTKMLEISNAVLMDGSFRRVR